MHTRARTALLAALVLGVTAVPAVPALAAPASVTAPARTPVSDADAAALAAAIADLREDGATAALVRVGGTDGVWRGSAGVHDLASARPADPRARFRAGSVTKAFTAAVVLQLAAEGRVSLDSPVRAYLPELVPAAYGDVTVRQLLNHTHGMPSPVLPGSTVEEWYADRFRTYTPQEMVASALAREPEFRPGARQDYTNIGYTLAGLLIEEVTRDTYERQVARRVIRPLHLHGTYLPGTDPRIRGPHNRGYQVFGRPDGSTELRDVSVWSQTQSWAAGDLISTTADLERFVAALFSGRLVRGPLLEEMFILPRLEEGTASYSVGLSRMMMDGRPVWGKTGGRWGYNAGFAATRGLSRTFVYSVNSTDAKGQDVSPVVLKIATAAFGSFDHG